MTDTNYIRPSFRDFILKHKNSRLYIFLVLISSVLQFGIFKYYYPFPNFIHGDSFEYLRTAFYNFDINTYMVGYSRFLRLFSVITSSDLILTFFQYFLIQVSSIFFCLTLIYFYQPHNIIRVVLLVLMIFNPLYLHLANLISSDGFFLALSFVWFSLIIWLLHQPTKIIQFWLPVVLFIAFTVRYNGLLYPFLTAIIYLVSPGLTLKRKTIGVGVSFMLCGFFVVYTGNKYKELTGVWQYSPFSGWQLANNAMYAYRYVDSSSRQSTPLKFKRLDNMIRTYFDSSRDVKKHPQEAMLASTYYMWSPRLPLFKYRNIAFENDSAASDLKKWATMGPIYSEYGFYIIKTYPFHFARYFLWPNATRYFAPPVEFLEYYNMGKDSTALIAKAWFGFKSIKVYSRYKNPRITVLNFYPFLSGIINVVFICCIICFALLRGFKENSIFRKGLLFTIAVWCINAGFTIFASSPALRFQSFPILLATTFVLFLLDWLWKAGINISRSENKIIPTDTAINPAFQDIIAQ